MQILTRGVSRRADRRRLVNFLKYFSSVGGGGWKFLCFSSPSAAARLDYFNIGGGGGCNFSPSFFKIFLFPTNFETDGKGNDSKKISNKKLDKNIPKTNPECRKFQKTKYSFFCRGGGG